MTIPPQPPQTTARAMAQPLRVATLPTRKATGFDLRPDQPWLLEIIADLGLITLRKLSFKGEISIDGPKDWRLVGQLGATVVQPCVITAEPVTTRIDTPVLRRFMAQMPEPSGPEAEIPEDDTLEPLGEEIDPVAVMIEALSLALPDYPRAPGAELGGISSPPEGAITAFSVLKALKGRDNSDG
jgi:uncharacterized metal-binding protein YceD (DUF177 family)